MQKMLQISQKFFVAW